MFERLVRNLLLGYLGRYIKDFDKDQLKITLWHEEVLLENVELILEAFDYLQLPFALKQARVGRLSIKIPWKKLGWDPIIIILEDILVCASQHDDEEWSMDAVERREVAGKKAKLAAAELAKLSRRVCDNQAGKSFISYITAKILDGVQVSIRNFHVIYRDMPSDQAETVFGLKFSSLTAMKQSLVGVSSGKVRVGQVNKLVEIQGLEIYCSTFQGTPNFMKTDNGEDLVSLGNARFPSDKYISLLAPVDISVSLLVNRSGRLENNAPQYSVDVESTGLVLSLDVDQLKQILSLCDYLSTCRLREKYGRYRPWRSPLSKRLKGWEIAWWHYAQQSVLSDVRKRLMKTSWKCLGERLNRRRRYVKLYKTKLECLRQEQLLDEATLWELDQMEKEYDIDDILSYRSAAECELQEFLVDSSSTVGANDANISVDKSLDDERLSSKPQGWLKWLSRGMLGAGGTDDSSQFSGVVSDEVIKDIYEATKFHPVPSSNVDASASDEVLLSSIKFSVHQISARLHKKFDHAIAELIFEGILVECMIWQDSAVVSASVNSVEMINPLNEQAVLLVKRVISGENVLVVDKPSLNIQAYAPTANHEGELTIKVMIQPLEVTCDSTFLFNIRELYAVLESFKFQQERVLISLNGINDVNTRLKSKAEYIFSIHKRMMWDISLIDVKMIIPWENAKSELRKLVLESSALSFASKRSVDCFAPNMDVPPQFMRNIVDSTSTGELLMGFQLQDLYNHFEIKLNDFEMKMIMPCHPHIVPVLEKFNASIALACCIVPDESSLKAFEVYVVSSALLAHFSPSIFGSFLELIANVNMLDWPSDLEIGTSGSSFDMSSNEPNNSNIFCFSAIVNLESATFLVDLENDSEASCTLMVSLQEVDIRCAITESTKCWICTKALRITSQSLKSEDSRIICSSKSMFASHSAQRGEVGGKISSEDESCDDSNTSVEGCFILHYEANRNLDLILHKYKIWLGDVDIHFYPYIIGLLVGFADKISMHGASHAAKDQSVMEGKGSIAGSNFEFPRFGCSNFFETSSSDWANIPVDHYPFVTIKNVGSLLNLESSLKYAGADWRKILNLRESKIKSSRISAEKEFKILNAQSKSTFGTYVLPKQPDPDLADLIVIDLNLGSIRVHFHDSSCIVATVTLPAAKSLFSIREDCLDMLCSTEGLNLSSSWWPQTLHDFLWGPTLPNLSPILNVRMRKGNFGLRESVFEIDLSIHHVSCILPPEFLAIVIGYISLPDWNSNAKEQPVTDAHKDLETDNNVRITYKFEILDSTLFTPVESVGSQFLKLDIQQLYCTFVLNSDSNMILKEIPVECLVPAHKIANRNHCLNLFGRDLSLSLLMLKDNVSDSFKLNPDVEHRTIILIAPISADAWIRIPYEFESSCTNSFPSTCVMSRVTNCRLIAEGSNVLIGYEALQDVIDQLSSVEKQSQAFTSDVFQFLQLKRSLKENDSLPLESSSAIFTEISCSVQSMSVNFYCPRIESSVPELFARTDLQFMCSSSLRNDKPLRLDFSFTSLALSSLLHSVMLVECIPPCPNLSVLDMNMLMSDQDENQLLVSLPSLDIWLYLSAWSEIIDLFNSYSEQLSKTKIANAASKKSTLDLADQVDVTKHSPQSHSVSSYYASENIMQNHFSLSVKSENVGIRVHIPVRVCEEAFKYFGAPQVHEQRPLNIVYNNIVANQYCFFVVSSQSRCCELVCTNERARFKSNLGNTSGTVELCQDKSVHVWPFFQLLQVDVEAEIPNYQMEHAHMKMTLRCDSLDVWLSHHIFYFWQCMLFEFPEADSSQFPPCDIDLTIQLQKLSLLLTDRKWSSNGPLLEILMRNLLLHARVTENKIESSVDGGLDGNYNNIHKVMWEPFLEPWKFHLSIRREHGKSALQNSPVMTDIHLESTTQLNMNITESFIEVIFRTTDMIKDAWDLMGLSVISESSRFSGTEISDNAYTTRYAPYILQNLTSLPLVFHVCEGPISADGLDVSALKNGNFVQPGSSYPVYIDDTPEEQFLRFSRGHSSDKIGDKQFTGARHRYVIVQLEGTSTISTPISIDLVGISFFEVDFSNSSNNLGAVNIGDVLKGGKEFEGRNRVNTDSGYVVPVVIDVSMQRYTKLVRLYSTVILLNATSVPFEVRFDIPFGVAPKVLDPVYPGQEFPLPLHLAEAGRIRWRPLGSTYIWSEAYSISNILSNESKIGVLRSFVCYPSLPSCDPFRCCVSVHDMCLPKVGKLNKPLYLHDTLKKSLERSFGEVTDNLDCSTKRFIHLVSLSSPLVVKNYLPVTVSLTVESGGVTRTVLLSEVETSFFHIDSSHDLSMVFHMHGFRPSVMKFPRVEIFGEMAKFSGTKFSLTETIAFNSDLSEGPLYITMLKVMDAFSGAREICIFVPFLLYNCSGFPLIVSNSVNEPKTHGCAVPSCYDMDEQDPLLGRKEGLCLLSSHQDLDGDGLRNISVNNHVVSTRKSVGMHNKFLKEPLNLSGSATALYGSSDKRNLDAPKSSFYNQEKSSGPSSQSNMKTVGVKEIDCRKVNFCMYSPEANTSASEITVRVSRCLSECAPEITSDHSWSNPFFLVPSTGSTTILVPQTSTNAAYVISVTSSAVAEPFSGRTRIINFQPRYVISNACSKDLCYRQKGSDFVFHLRAGQHSHIHWTDITRELLVSVRFDEPGWQWSGCFLPEHLGDTQLKMRNYVSGAVNMMRVEVQNTDVSIRDEKIVGNPHGNSGTNLILLSDDDTGFMPYRIDNFSKERLRIYQQKCEAFETVIHSYTSCPYAWDEPCYPHRLTVEVPAERVVGSFTLDDAKEYKPVHLPATSEKPERTLLISVHAEGALKVLSVIDSSYHTFNAMKGPHFPRFNEKREHEEKQGSFIHYKERISVAISFIGISVMNSYPQELLFVCARNTMIELVQSLDQQKYSFKISSLQIDNQLHSTPYPVILSFDHDYKNNQLAQIRTKDDRTKINNDWMKQSASESSHEPVFSLAAAKWRNKDIALVSFEYISLRVADFHLELEQEVILSLFDFFKTVSSRFQSSAVPHTDPFLHPLSTNFSIVRTSSKYPEARDFEKADGDQLHSISVPMFVENQSNPLLPSIVPIGAPWQKIYLLARKQKKIYVELIDLAPIKLTLSFSSTPWMLRNGILTSGEYLIHRGLMALADVEGAQIHLRQLTIAHQLASWESIQEILIRHYTRQLLHEMYKVFGSAGVIGNPMGFARSVGHGIKDFLSVPARSFSQSPSGLIAGMAQGTTSLLSNTVYAISDAATQFSRAAHKGIVAFTFDNPAATEMEKQQKGMSSHGKGVINEVLEGLTGLLQSPIKGAEKHGLPGVVSGIALGVTGLVARPAASILEVTEKTARSIRNRSKLYRVGSQRLRIRLPRPLSRDLPLMPYSWEEAVGISVLADADDSLMLKAEVLVLSKALKQSGKFVIITERLILLVSCSSLVNLGKPEFRGIPTDPDWVIEAEIRLESVIHADNDAAVVHIVGSSSDILLRQNQKRGVVTSAKRWYNTPTPLPLFQTNLEFSTREEAVEFLPVLLSTIEKGKERGWGCVYRLHQSNLK